MNLNADLDELGDTALLHSEKPHKPITDQSIKEIYPNQQTQALKAIEELICSIEDIEAHIAPIALNKVISKHQALDLLLRFPDIWPPNIIPEQLSSAPSKIGYTEAFNAIRAKEQQLNNLYHKSIKELKILLHPKHLEAIILISDTYLDRAFDAMSGVFNKCPMVFNCDEYHNRYYMASKDTVDIINTPLSSLCKLDIELRIAGHRYNDIDSFKDGLVQLTYLLENPESHLLLVDVMGRILGNAGVLVSLCFKNVIDFIASPTTRELLVNLVEDLRNQIHNVTDNELVNYTDLEANERGLINLSILLTDILTLCGSLSLCMGVLRATV